MVTTKHCCCGDCKSDSRTGCPTGVYFIGYGNGYPKPSVKAREKCIRWVESCGRKHFTIRNVNKDTYICSLHFVDGKGPSDEYPDPIKCGTQVIRSRKRKPPTERQPCRPAKQQHLDRHEAAEGMLLLTEAMPPTVEPAPKLPSPPATQPIFKSVGVNCTPETDNKKCQTEKQASSDIVQLSIKNRIMQNDIKLRDSDFQLNKPEKKFGSSRPPAMPHHDAFGIDSVKHDDVAFKFYTGLTYVQFLCLWAFLGESVRKMNYWNCPVGDPNKTPSKTPSVVWLKTDRDSEKNLPNIKTTIVASSTLRVSIYSSQMCQIPVNLAILRALGILEE